MEILTVIDYYREVQMDAAKIFYESTCHYMKLDNGNPKPHGTGVFIEVDSNYFLLTAAHVIDQQENDIYIGVDKHEFLKLGGELIVNSVRNSSLREDDKCDIAIFKLTEETVEKLKNRYKFIPKHELGINQHDVYLPEYLAIGFPATKSKYNSYKDEIKSHPFIYTTLAASQEVYEELRCLRYVNIIVHYEKEKVVDYNTGQTLTGPDPFGMSGCGLWHIPPQIVENGEYIKKNLVGILTEWPVENRNYFIGTRIDLFTEVIRQNYKLNLEKSNIVKLDI